MLDNTLVFDIETVPDVDAGARLYQLGDLPAEQVVKAMQAIRREKTGGSDFLPLYLHRVVAISIGLRTREEFRIWSLGDEESSEEELVQRFFTGIERYNPVLVSWNGTGFDLPVLHYRSLLGDVSAGGYWEVGDNDREYRWNNYINRFHWRHIDLMDILAGHQARANAPLDDISKLLDLPGKGTISGKDVCSLFLDGKLETIRSYCETDVLNTYLIYLRFEALRGRLNSETLHSEQQAVRKALAASDRAHLKAFLADWQQARPTPEQSDHFDGH